MTIDKSNNENLVCKVISGFKRLVVIGTLAAAAVMLTGCAEEQYLISEISRSIAFSVSDYARKKIQEGDLDAGIKYLKEASQIRAPDMFDSYHLGIAYKKEGDLTNAEKYFKKATLGQMREDKYNDQIQDIRAKAYFELGLMYMNKEGRRDIKRARSYFHKATKCNSEYTEAYLHYGKLSLRLDDIEEAKSAYERAAGLKEGEEKIQLYEKVIQNLEEADKKRGGGIYSEGIDAIKSKLEKAKGELEHKDKEDSLDEEVEQELLESPQTIAPEDKSDSDGLGYVLLTGGGGGEAGAGSVGVGLEVISRIKQKYILAVGGGMLCIFNEDEYWEYEEEIFLAGGLGFKNSFIVGTIGVSFQDSKDEEQQKIRLTYSAQLKHIHKKLIIGAGYHNRIGFVGSLGFGF